MEHTIFICDCGNLHHQFIVSKDEEYKETYISVQLNNRMNFFTKIKQCWKILWNNHFEYETILLNEEQVEKLKSLL